MDQKNKFELVKVTYFINPYQFWIDRAFEDDEFENFSRKLQKHAENSSACVPEIGMVVAVQEEKNKIWKRAEIENECDIEVIKSLDNSVAQLQQISYKVWLVDDGRPAHIFKRPRKLSVQFREKETKVERAAVHGILPATKNFDFIKETFEICRINEWSAASSKLIHKLLKINGVKVYFCTKKQLDNVVTGDLVIESQMKQINVAEYICQKKLALMDEKAFLVDLLESGEIINRVKTPHFISSSCSASSSGSFSNKNSDLQNNLEKEDLIKTLQKPKGNLNQFKTYEIPVDVKKLLDYESPISCKTGIMTTLRTIEKNKSKVNNALSEHNETLKPNTEKVSPEIVLNRTIGRGRKKHITKENNLSSSNNNQTVGNLCKENNEMKVTKGRGIQIVKFSPKKYEEFENKHALVINQSKSTENINNERLSEMYKTKIGQNIVLENSKKCNDEMVEQIENKKKQKSSTRTNLVRFGKILLSEKKDQKKSPVKSERCDSGEVELDINKELDSNSCKHVQPENESVRFEELISRKIPDSELINTPTGSNCEKSLFDKKNDLLLNMKKKSHSLDTSLNSKVSNSLHSQSDSSIESMKDKSEELNKQNQSSINENISVVEKLNEGPKWPIFDTNNSNKTVIPLIPSGYNLSNLNKRKEVNKNAKIDHKMLDESKCSLKNSSSSEDNYLEEKLKESKLENQFAYEKILYSRSHNEFHKRQPRLLIHSTMNITRIHSIETSQFCPTVIAALRYLGNTQLSTVQGVTWNAILRGLNGIVVESRFQYFLSDKYRIFTYLPPLCDNLINTDYKEFGAGYGPYALILCANRTAVRNVFELATNLVYGCPKEKKPRIAFLLNGNAVITSCNLLITTPRCFLRRMDCGGPSARVTNLKRLCYFVLNEGDIISHRYPNELNEILKICHSVLQERRIGYNLQLLATAEEWTPALEKLCTYTPVTPTIIIKPPVEAALYGRVNIKLYFVNGEQKISKMNDILEKQYSLFRTIIVCNTREEINYVYKNMEALGFKVNYIHNETQRAEIDRIVYNWKQSVSGAHWILLAMDEILSDVHISSAFWLIHYSLPHSWTHFSYRFFTLTENYPNLLTSVNQNSLRCQVHIFIDEENTIQIPRIVSFLKRMKVEISPQLHEIYKTVINEREAKRAIDGVPLCNSLLSWGYCSLDLKCKGRHKIFSGHDEPLSNITIGSAVKLRLLKLHDVVHFSARLLNSVTDQYSYIAMKMNQHFNKNNTFAFELNLKHLYAFNNNGLYQRCKILEIFNNDAKIQLIDDGDIIICKKLKLMELPKELSEIAPQAIDVYICGLKPVDDETLWDIAGRTYINNLLTKYDVEKPTSYLHGIVKLVLKEKIWIEKVQLFEEFKTTSTVVNKLNLSNVLIQENFAAKNPDHMKILYSLCKEGNIKVQEDNESKKINILTTRKKLQKNIQKAHMSIGEKFERMHFLSTGENNKFYLSFKKYDKILEYLIIDIKKKISLISYPNQVDCSNGVICIAYIPAEDICHRVLILEYNNDSSMASCWLLDEGYSLEIPRSNLWYAETWMLERLPAQAIHCRLFGVICNSEEELIYYEGSRNMWARCVKKDPDGIYCVILQECDINNDLINLRLANLNKENRITMEELLESDFLIEKHAKNSSSISSNSEDSFKCDGSIDESNTKSGENSLKDLDIEFDEDDLNDFCRSFLKNGKSKTEDNPCNKKEENSLQDFDKEITENNDLQDISSESLLLNRSPIDKSLASDKVVCVKSDIYTPTVLWHQTEKLIVLKVQLVDVKICDVHVNENVFHFSLDHDSKKYQLDLKLYSLVNNDPIFYEARGLEVHIELEKTVEGEKWPRLLFSKQRCRYVKTNLSHELSDSESEDDGKVKPCLQTLGKIVDDNDSVKSEDKIELDYDFGSEDDSSSDYLSDEYAD